MEDDVSEGLKQGVENELNSMSVCMPKSPVGGGGGVHWICNVCNVHVF